MQIGKIASTLGSAALLMAVLEARPALAQAVNNGAGATSGKQIAGPTQPSAEQALDPPPIERLFGDWDSPQTKLWQEGVNLQFDAITEFAGNVSGGVKQGATFANQVGFGADLNWERLAGLTGLSTHLIVVNRSGSSDSALFGDNLSPVQEIYGSGGDVGVHLVSAYAEETLLDKRFDLELGRMNVENAFASSPLYCNFMNNGLCGDPKALPGGDRGHSAYPDAVWGSRIKVRPVPSVYVETGIYEVNQGLYSYANFRSGFKFDDSQDSGVYLPVEIGWEPKFGADQLPGHYKLGFGYDTSGGYEDYANALATAGVAGYTARSHRGNAQAWALFDQMLLRNGPGKSDGITGVAGFIHNDPRDTIYAEQYFGGLIDQDFWAARPKDSFGLLFMYYAMSSHLGEVQDIEQSLDIPLSNSATGVQRHEIIFEAEYNIHVFRGVNFKPDFQYVIRPNAQANIGDATVFGFQAHVEF
jgi:porin